MHKTQFEILKIILSLKKIEFMRSTFKILFYLKRDKVKKDGSVPLFCRITVDGKEVRFGMKCDINPKYWDVKTSKAIGRTADAAKINTLIDNTKSALYNVYRELQERDNYVTAEKIRNLFLGIEQKSQTLLGLFDSHNEERKLQIGINLTRNTYRRYCITRRYIVAFLLYQYNLTDIPVKELNRQFIADFDMYLTTQYDLARNYIVSLLSSLKHVMHVAVSKEWIVRNPFSEHKLQPEKVERGYLTQSEIEMLIDCQFQTKQLERARDIFIFCVFTGLAFADVKNMKAENIRTSIEGNKWIMGKRLKTNVEYNIPLMNIPRAILEKYKDNAKNGLMLPVFALSDYNKHLKKVAAQCGITKRMTSHLARHTFATLALTKGVSIESVSKMLGHTNIATTQIYARITNKKIGTEMNEFAGKVKVIDTRFQPVKMEDVIIVDVLKSLKITVKVSDKIWETLSKKVWCKMSSIEHQLFVSEMDKREDKPVTMSDFYSALIDYFLDNLNIQSNCESTFSDTRLAANF